MNNEDARGEAAFFSCEQQTVENGKEGNPNKVAWFCPAYSLYEVHASVVPVYQVPNTLSCVMPLLFSLPEIFSPLICLVKHLFILQNSDL